MAAIDFPSSPLLNDEFTHPTTGTIYVWNGSQWILKFSASGNYNVPDASVNTKGVLFLATDPDINAGVNTTKAVTPAQLANAIASVTAVSNATTTVYGKTRLATTAESAHDTAAVVGGNEDDVVTLAGLFNRTPQASSVVRGTLFSATQGEVNNGVVVGGIAKAVTPETLAARTATETRSGGTRLASVAEASANSLTPVPGTENEVVTLAGLFARIANTARAGLIEIADTTDIANLANDKAVTPAQLIANTTLPGTIAMWPLDSVPLGWIKCNGAAVSRVNYNRLFDALVTNVGYTPVTAGVTWDTNGAFTKLAHDLKTGARLRFLDPLFSVGATVPGGLVANRDYYVIVDDVDHFRLTSDRLLTVIMDTSSASGLGETAHYQRSVWGLGDEVDVPTNFNVPNVTDFVRSTNDNRGIGLHEDDMVGPHNHDTGFGETNTDISSGLTILHDPNVASGHTTMDNVGVETRPKNVALNYIIKF